MNYLFPTLFLFVSTGAAALVELPVQGQLVDEGAAIIGPIDLEFRVVGTTGDLSCEAFTGVPLIDGVFTLTLGAGDGAACDALLDTLDEAIFAEAGLTVDVLFNGATFSFPVGEAGRAGFALTAETAQRLGGLDANAFVRADPRVIYAPEGALTAALATAATAGVPAVVIAGPGTHVGNFTVPPVTTLRGAARGQTIIEGRVVLQTAAALESLTVENNVGLSAIETNGDIGCSHSHFRRWRFRS